MKQSEAEALVVKMKQLWGNPFKVTSNTAVEWAQHAQHVTYEQMSQAIDHFANIGDKFPPSLAEVVARAKAGASPRQYQSDRHLRICNYCGGPYYGGEQSDELKAHYSWCFNGTATYTLNDVHRNIEPAYSDPSLPVVPPPQSVRDALASLATKGS
jgi:hypothetical protein